MPSSFFNATAPTDISPLSLHDALPILDRVQADGGWLGDLVRKYDLAARLREVVRSEEHTSELHSRLHLLCPPLFLTPRRPPTSPLFPYTTLFRSWTGSRRTEAGSATWSASTTWQPGCVRS